MSMHRHPTLAGLAMVLVAACLIAGCPPAQALEPAQAVESASASLVLNWGDALASALQALAGALVPVLVAVVTTLAARFAGPLRFLITSTLVERLVRNATDYAINAVSGAVRGRTLSVPLGSAVIARAVQRGLEEGPAWLVRSAGGREGLAEKVFRSLSLEDAATIANTLRPALAGHTTSA